MWDACGTHRPHKLLPRRDLRVALRQAEGDGAVRAAHPHRLQGQAVLRREGLRPLQVLEEVSLLVARRCEGWSGAVGDLVLRPLLLGPAARVGPATSSRGSAQTHLGSPGPPAAHHGGGLSSRQSTEMALRKERYSSPRLKWAQRSWIFMLCCSPY